MKIEVYEGAEKCKYGCGQPARFRHPGARHSFFTCGTSHNVCPEVQRVKKAKTLERWGVEFPNQSPEMKAKHIDTSMERYGVSHPQKTIGQQNRIKATNLEKYGVENVFAAEEVKNRIKETHLERYGVENVSQAKEVQEKREQTFLAKYGVTSALGSEEVWKKIRATNLERYGVECMGNSRMAGDKAAITCMERYGGVGFASKILMAKTAETMLKRYGGIGWASAVIRAKTSETMLKRYGVAHASQCPAIRRLAEKSALVKREFVVNGKTFWLQGEGEKKVLMELIEDCKLSPEDIINDCMDPRYPKIVYFWNGMERRYFPDFFIPRLNWVVEVKSTWTFLLHKSQNLAKRTACRGLGYQFNFVIR